MRIVLNFTDEKIEQWLSHAVCDWADLRNSKGDWRKGTLRFSYDKESDNEGEMTGRARIGRGAVAKGLAVMVKEAPALFAQMLEDNDDMITCDALVQSIVFGKIIYG